jgi:hypothetical protein
VALPRHPQGHGHQMTIAYYPLHYGSDYLTWSIMSIYDQVDKIYILYTDKPSHGHGTTMKNPDSREKLRTAAFAHDPGKKVVWHEGQWRNEGEQRNTISHFADLDSADLIVAVDSDEIWDHGVLERSIAAAKQSTSRNHLIRMLTLWRSFSWHCLDEMWPCRIVAPKRKTGTTYLGDRVFHFGYARSVEEVQYKISCHGHRDEWRGEWFEEKYKKWPACGNKDLHPTCVNVWNAEKYDKTLLPSLLKAHPYWSLDVIP